MVETESLIAITVAVVAIGLAVCAVMNSSFCRKLYRNGIYASSSFILAAMIMFVIFVALMPEQKLEALLLMVVASVVLFIVLLYIVKVDRHGYYIYTMCLYFIIYILFLLTCVVFSREVKW